jgi:RNA recognition motif-containing protein
LLTDKETGKRKGFGFIEMPVRDQAKAAITALNDKEVYGRELALKEAEDKDEAKPGNFQQPRRELRNSGGTGEEVDGNRW